MTGQAEQADTTLAAFDALAVPLRISVTDRPPPGPGLGGRSRRRPPGRPCPARSGGRPRRRDRRPDRRRECAARPGPPGPGPPRGRPPGRLWPPEVDGDLVAARAAYANAIAARDSEALEKVSGDFEVLGANLYAAEARAEAAVLLRRAGRARDAAAVRAESGAAAEPAARGRSRRRSGDHGPGTASRPASSTPPGRPPRAVRTGRSPPTFTSRYGRSKATCSASTKSSGSRAVASCDALRDQRGHLIRRRTRPERATDAEQRVEQGQMNTGHVDY